MQYYCEEKAASPPLPQEVGKASEDSYQLQQVCQQSSKHTNEPMLALSSKVGRSSEITFS